MSFVSFIPVCVRFSVLNVRIYLYLYLLHTVSKKVGKIEINDLHNLILISIFLISHIFLTFEYLADILGIYIEYKFCMLIHQ